MKKTFVTFLLITTSIIGTVGFENCNSPKETTPATDSTKVDSSSITPATVAIDSTKKDTVKAK